MGDYDLYRARMNAYGNTIKDGNVSATTNMIKSAFYDSPSFSTVSITDNALVSAIKVTALIGDFESENSFVTITYDVPGIVGNDFVILIVNGNVQDGDLSAELSLQDKEITLTLGMTDEVIFEPDDTKNTATLIATELSKLNGFTAVYDGTGEGVPEIEDGDTVQFSGGANAYIGITTTKNVHIVDNSSLNKMPGNKIIICYPGDSIFSGDIVTWGTEKWLCVANDDVCGIYEKGIILLCNNTLTIKTGETKVLTGYDPMKKPIYTITPSYTNYLCVVDTKLLYNRFMVKNEPIQLPDGRLNITIQYKANHGISLGVEFNMYGGKYQIQDIDFTDVINNKGIISFMADRKQGE